MGKINRFLRPQSPTGHTFKAEDRVRLKQELFQTSVSRFGIPPGLTISKAVGTVKDGKVYTGDVIEVLWDGNPMESDVPYAALIRV
ncbi:MAG: hypothetical protein COY40_06835 [Alphaproteobacteria bacterium CG_4_10_14_0_8_um_filter_53_9]|nr:MAG: hypothetical protein COY40_06835 [Alphaproteobacteria bacterium CG_4_10_14_0_8_um_filter_53_9]